MAKHHNAKPVPWYPTCETCGENIYFAGDGWEHGPDPLSRRARKQANQNREPQPSDGIGWEANHKTWEERQYWQGKRTSHG